MSDDPFAAFKEGQPPSQDASAAKPAKEKKPRKKKIPPKKTTGVVTQPAAGYKVGDTVTVKGVTPKVKKTRKPRQAKEMRLPISTLLEIGSLSDEESGALLSIGAGLQKLPKKSRQKISAALSKIFG